MVDQIIRPSALTRRTNPVASEIVPVDNGTSVAGSTLAEIVNAGRPVASRPEAEAGVNAEKSMSPLTTKQSIASEVGVTLASKAQGDRADSAVRTIVEGDGIAVDSSDPQNPKISVTATIPPGGILEPMYGTGSVSSRALANESVTAEKVPDGELPLTKLVAGQDGQLTTSRGGRVLWGDRPFMAEPLVASIGDPTDLTFEEIHRHRGFELISIRNHYDDMTADMNLYSRSGGGVVTYDGDMVITQDIADGEAAWRSFSRLAVPLCTAILQVTQKSDAIDFSNHQVGFARVDNNDNAAFNWNGVSGDWEIGAFVGGVYTVVASGTRTMPSSFRMAMTVTADWAEAWVNEGKSWICIGRANIGINFRDPEIWRNYRPRFAVRAGSDGAVTKIGSFEFGYSGQVGLRDFKFVTRKRGAPYIVNGEYFLTASCSSSQGVGHSGIFAYNPRTNTLRKTGALVSLRDGLMKLDVDSKIVWDDDANLWRVWNSTWGDGFGTQLDITYQEYKGELLNAVTVMRDMQKVMLSMRQSSKADVRVATTTNITLSGLQTVDGVTLLSGDRILVKDQASEAANGIYVVSSGSWTRADDANSWADIRGARVQVAAGSTQSGQIWANDVAASGTLGATSMPWTRYGVYALDAMWSDRDGCWLLYYNYTPDLQFVGSPHRGALDTSIDLETFTFQWQQSADDKAEGASICKVGGEHYFLSGSTQEVFVYDINGAKLGAINFIAPDSGPTSYSPFHGVIFPVFEGGRTFYRMLCHDDTQYGESFSWGVMHVYEATQSETGFAHDLFGVT